MKKSAGLTKRGEIWHFNKKVCGKTIRGSSGTSDLDEAELMLAMKVAEVRREVIFGEAPSFTFSQAIAKYAQDKAGKKSLDRDLAGLAKVEPYIGDTDIKLIHIGTLSQYIKDQQAKGVKNISINRELASVRQVLSRAARVWRHNNNKPYIDSLPLIELLSDDSRQPCQLSMDEQSLLLGDMSAPHARYALFLVNTGGRCKETLNLRWDWKVAGQPAFMIPADQHKNGKERVLACNSTAWSIVEAQRGEDKNLVFPIGYSAFRMGWDRARQRQNLNHLRRHDLKHTFGMRLRAAGVSFEDRQDLLGHSSSRITDHYCTADVSRLVEAAETVANIQVEPKLRVIGRR